METITRYEMAKLFNVDFKTIHNLIIAAKGSAPKPIGKAGITSLGRNSLVYDKAEKTAWLQTKIASRGFDNVQARLFLTGQFDGKSRLDSHPFKRLASKHTKPQTRVGHIAGDGL